MPVKFTGVLDNFIIIYVFFFKRNEIIIPLEAQTLIM